MTEVVEIGFSTNCNCPNGDGDVTIALNARTLDVASESDRSLPVHSQRGQVGAPTHASLGRTSESKRSRNFASGSVPSGLIRIWLTPIAAKRFR